MYPVYTTAVPWLYWFKRKSWSRVSWVRIRTMPIVFTTRPSDICVRSIMYTIGIVMFYCMLILFIFIFHSIYIYIDIYISIYFYLFIFIYRINFSYCHLLCKR